jgi:phage-related protein
MQWVFATVVQIIKSAATMITGILNIITGTFKLAFAIIRGILTGDFSGAVEAFKQVLQGWGQYLRGAMNFLLSPFIGLVDGIRNFLRGIDFFAIAVNWINSLIAGIKSRAGGIGGAIKQGIENMLPEGVRKLIPGFADGVRNFSGGLAIVGERGPELVNLPKGADVFTNEESRKMTAGGGGITIETMNIKSGVDWELGASYMAQKLRLS